MKKILLSFLILLTIINATAQCNISGTISAANNTLPGMRLFRDGIPSTCTSPKGACPGMTNPAGVFYATHSITNNNVTSVDVNALVNVDDVLCTGANQVIVVAYNGTFDPFNICSNYISDLGNSPTPTGSFCFTMPASSTFTLVVMMANTGSTCLGAGYNINVCSALPLDLVSFEGKRHNNGIGLYWQTAQEINTSHFDIERKINEQSFEKIAQVDAKGFSTVNENYSYLDIENVVGQIYYRLKQYDADGAFTYSHTVHMRTTKLEGIIPYLSKNVLQKGEMLHIAYPNRYAAIDSRVSVYSVSGPRLALLERDVTKNELEWSTKDLESGLYILQVQDDGILHSYKFVVK